MNEFIEPADTLGDTTPAELDEAPEAAHAATELGMWDVIPGSPWWGGLLAAATLVVAIAASAFYPWGLAK